MGTLASIKDTEARLRPSRQEVPIEPPALRGDDRSLIEVAIGRFSLFSVRARRTPIIVWSEAPLGLSRWRGLTIAALLVGGAFSLGFVAQHRSTVRLVMEPQQTVRRALPRSASAPRPVRPASPRRKNFSAAFEPPMVVGIVGRLPGDAVVLVKDKAATRMVAVGSDILGWRLVELSPTTAVFMRDGERRAVELPATE